MVRFVVSASLVLALFVSAACSPEPETVPPNPDKEDFLEGDSVLLDAAARILHPIIDTVCRTQQSIYLNECLIGTETDADADGRIDGGIWPLTIYSSDKTERKIGRTDLNEAMCTCTYQMSVKLCDELDLPFVRTVLYDFIRQYVEGPGLMALLSDLINGYETEDCLDFDCNEWELDFDLEDPDDARPDYEPSSTAVRRALAAEVLRLAMADADNEFPDAPSVCECRRDSQCGDGSFCVDRICSECRSDSDCDDGDICELHSCRAP